jgi:hypothetical protein
MPGAVPVTATAALTNVTLPRVVRLADGGVERALGDAELRSGINVHAGRVTNQAVAAALGVTQSPLDARRAPPSDRRASHYRTFDVPRSDTSELDPDPINAPGGAIR